MHIAVYIYMSIFCVPCTQWCTYWPPCEFTTVIYVFVPCKATSFSVGINSFIRSPARNEYLVGGFNPLIGNLPQVGVKIKHIWNHHPDISNEKNPWDVSLNKIRSFPKSLGPEKFGTNELCGFTRQSHPWRMRWFPGFVLPPGHTFLRCSKHNPGTCVHDAGLFPWCGLNIQRNGYGPGEWPVIFHLPWFFKLDNLLELD